MASEYALNQVITFGMGTYNSNGALTDADSTPTFAIYEETTDTDIGVGGNMTKRTSLTGRYRGQATLSAANGFEVGKMYHIWGLATVNGTAGGTFIEAFRVCAAESTAGYVSSDVKLVNGNSTAGSNLGAAAGIMVQGTAVTGTLSSTVFTTNLSSSTDDAYKDRSIFFLTGALAGQAKTISAYNGTTKAITVSAAFTTAPSNTDAFIIV